MKKNKLGDAFESETKWVIIRKNSIIYRILKRVLGEGRSTTILFFIANLFSVYSIKRKDVVVTNVNHFYVAITAAVKKPRANKILFLMDPVNISHNCMIGEKRISNRDRIPFDHYDYIFTTPATAKAMLEQDYKVYKNKIVVSEFPLLEKHVCSDTNVDVAYNPNMINLLYCGTIYEDCTVRDPSHLLRMIDHLDEHFAIWFVGTGCKELGDSINLNTKAELHFLNPQSHETVIGLMENADVLINIANNIPVYTPSKLIEYISTGKPILNFYQQDNDPTLPYIDKYPLSKNVRKTSFDKDDHTANGIIQFCKENKGKTIDFETISRLFETCTPEYVANQIMEIVEERFK